MGAIMPNTLRRRSFLPYVLASSIAAAITAPLLAGPACAAPPAAQEAAVSLMVKHRLTLNARESETALKAFVPFAFLMVPGVSDAEWRREADRFDERAVLVETTPKEEVGFLDGLGASADELRLVAAAIRDGIASGRLADDRPMEHNTVEILHLDPAAHASFIDAAWDRFTTVLFSLRDDDHRPWVAKYVVEEGDAIFFEVNTGDADDNAAMVAALRTVAAEHGATW
jgi:hypothetical protein